MPFTFTPTEIPDVIEVTPKIFGDDRGWFAELFKASDFAAAGIPGNLSQTNFSKSTKNVLRGMHYQAPPKAQSKLVVCLSGEVFDVAVDMRKNSSTYGKWVGRTLTAEKKNMLFIPRGFAHGFCVTSAEAEVMYFCDEEYSPEHEGGIAWNDEAVGITWPTTAPILADRDNAFPKLIDTGTVFEV